MILLYTVFTTRMDTIRASWAWSVSIITTTRLTKKQTIMAREQVINLFLGESFKNLAVFEGN